VNDIGVKLAKDIDESPGYGLFVSVPGIDVEVGIVYAFFGIVDIDGLGATLR
jgi:hypothetical protein